MKKLQVTLDPASPFYASPPSALQLWLLSILTSLLSNMSVYFDRIDTLSLIVNKFNKDTIPKNNNSFSTKALYKDNSSDLEQIKETEISDKSVDHDSKILNFLEKLESKGIPPVAIAIVFDAEVGSQPHFEQGFICPNRIGSNQNYAAQFYELHSLVSNEVVDGLRSWPAIYLRSTAHSTFSNGAPIRGKDLKKPSCAKLSHLSTSPSFDGSLNKARNHAASFLSFKSYQGRKNFSNDVKEKEESKNVLLPLVKYSEYWPSSGNKIWPHYEWPSMISLLQESASAYDRNKITNRRHHLTYGQAVTDRNFMPQQHDFLDSVVSSSLDVPVSQNVLSSSEIMCRCRLPSTRHYIRLSSRIWIVAIVKEDEEKKYRKKLKGSLDEEICSFLNEIAPDISIHAPMSIRSINQARLTSQQSEKTHFPSEFCNFFHEWQDGDMHQFLNQLKGTFGLRASSPHSLPLQSPYDKDKVDVNNRVNSSISSYHRKNSKTNSAMAFFLGKEITSLISK